MSITTTPARKGGHHSEIEHWLIASVEAVCHGGRPAGQTVFTHYSSCLMRRMTFEQAEQIN